MAPKKITRAMLAEHAAEIEPADYDYERPTTRRECAPWSSGPAAQRPCPFVACRHHLYLDIMPVTGAIKFNRPELAPEEMKVSCSLDVADAGCHTLEEVADELNLTRERARQIETRGLIHLRAHRMIKVITNP